MALHPLLATVGGVQHERIIQLQSPLKKIRVSFLPFELKIKCDYTELIANLVANTVV